MSKVFIEENTLTNLADAVRSVTGPLKTAPVEGEYIFERIVKSSNVVNQYYAHPNGLKQEKFYTTVTVPNAVKVEVYLKYLTASSSYVFLQVCPGSQEEFDNSATKYGGGSFTTTKTLTFNNTDTVTLYYECNSNYNSAQKFGIFARVRGYDVDGNLVTEHSTKEGLIENTMSTAEMITQLNNKPFYPSCEVSGRSDSSAAAYYEIDVNTINKLTFDYTIYPSGGANSTYYYIIAYRGYKRGLGSNTTARTLDNIIVDDNYDTINILNQSTGSSTAWPVTGTLELDVSNHSSVVLCLQIQKGSASYAYGSMIANNFKGE